MEVVEENYLKHFRPIVQKNLNFGLVVWIQVPQNRLQIENYGVQIVSYWKVLQFLAHFYFRVQAVSQKVLNWDQFKVYFEVRVDQHPAQMYTLWDGEATEPIFVQSNRRRRSNYLRLLLLSRILFSFRNHTRALKYRQNYLRLTH